MISHAVLEKYNSLAPYQNHDYHMFDFSQESISSIKEFLIRYCDDRKREGYFMLQDPLSSFYDALCVGIDDSSGKNHSRGRHKITSANNFPTWISFSAIINDPLESFYRGNPGSIRVHGKRHKTE
ncbi:uncharacterized protein LOC127255673 isoform X1 [Andrographis paniculata]|uniref:uncharacterized protein LOC127255673 isoform X1 n=1 Tax=Andrographis paniculata TaxID=175694 RepID=UPI0021E8434A|nr:uncharacterized protein LOC127255673 isoform X1 [Andrographis paniculata]